MERHILGTENDKGFSLVELIVVVLIIAIIAVALAPQVMKYVGEARESTTANTGATLKVCVQSAVAEYCGQEGVTSLNEVTYLIQSSDLLAVRVIPSGATDVNTAPTGGKSLGEMIQENLGTDSIESSYTAAISTSGAVTVAVSGAAISA